MQMRQSAVRERSYGSVKTFWLDRDYIDRQLEIAVHSLRKDPNIIKVVLFGSYAEGRAVSGSDIDMLLVLQVDSRRFVDRILYYLDIFADIGMAVDIFPIRSVNSVTLLPAGHRQEGKYCLNGKQS
jgi:uncharacterized protein